LGLFSEFLSQTTTFSAPLHLSSSVLLSSVFFILATILISGLALGVYATSVKIVEALRYE
jgi:ABC-type antimicrobial peptide transport system permease subunit